MPPSSLLVPVELTAERNVDGMLMDVNAVSSIYEKDVKHLLAEAIAQEKTGSVGIYYIKNGAALNVASGVQFPQPAYVSTTHGVIIHKVSEKVNAKISDVTQSLQFARWFGDWQNAPETQ